MDDDWGILYFRKPPYILCFQCLIQLRPVIYTFVLGCGQHSLKQYRVALRKACHEGLRDAGLSEDRHASDGAIGKFKSIDDKEPGNPWGFRFFPPLLLMDQNG